MVEAVSFKKRSTCYLSTPEHVNSFFGQFVYIYTNKGELCLTDIALEFVGKIGLTERIPHSILEIGVGRYSRLAKPLRLNFISIRYRSTEVERTLLFTPTTSWAWATPVWVTNKVVAEWVEALEDARSNPVRPDSAT